MIISEKPRSTRQHVLTITPSAHLSCFSKKFQGIPMSDYSPVNSPLPPLTEAHLSAIRARALAISPEPHLFSESKNSYGASETPSSTTTTVRESTASFYTMLYPSSRTSSAEPTEPATSPIESPCFPSAVSRSSPGSPIRVPARLRRMYAQFEGEQSDTLVAAAAAATGKGKVVVVGVTKTEGRDSSPSTSGASPVVDRKPSPEQRKTQRTGPRKRVQPPAPVPHLIKKSRGRRVPEPDEARERTHICAVPGCSKSFARAEHLKRHVISLHTHEKRTYLNPRGPMCPPFFHSTLDDELIWGGILCFFFFVLFSFSCSFRM